MTADPVYAGDLTPEVTVNTEARRRASQTYHQKRERMGLRKATFWLSPAARDVVEKLADVYGSKDAVVEAAILSLSDSAKKVLGKLPD
jgi:hypothetical protein